MTAELREVIEPDIFITGDANLLIEPEEKRDAQIGSQSRESFRIAVHVALIAFLIFTPKIFPAHVPTKDEIELARKQLQWIYSPPAIPEPPSPLRKFTSAPENFEKVAPAALKSRRSRSSGATASA